MDIVQEGSSLLMCHKKRKYHLSPGQAGAFCLSDRKAGNAPGLFCLGGTESPGSPHGLSQLLPAKFRRALTACSLM